VALPYFSDTAPTLLPLIRAIAFLMIVTAALRLTSFPFAVFGYQRFRGPLPTWDGWYVIVTMLVELTLAVGSMIVGIAGMRNPPRQRRLLMVWAWATLVAGAANILVRIYFYIFVVARAFPYVVSAIAWDVNNFLASATFPVVCLILARRRDVRQLFGEMTSA
jgi:hypothetical protein